MNFITILKRWREKQTFLIKRSALFLEAVVYWREPGEPPSLQSGQPGEIDKISTTTSSFLRTRFLAEFPSEFNSQFSGVSQGFYRESHSIIERTTLNFTEPHWNLTGTSQNLTEHLRTPVEPFKHSKLD